MVGEQAHGQGGLEFTEQGRGKKKKTGNGFMIFGVLRFESYRVGPMETGLHNQDPLRGVQAVDFCHTGRDKVDEVATSSCS